MNQSENKKQSTRAITQKIRTGQSFLYRQNGFESMVLEFHLNEPIVRKNLKNALDKALQRFDYLTKELKEIDGDFYLRENRRPMKLRESATFLPLGGSQVNGHLLDVHYSGQRVFIAYHHGVCDGRGILPFVRTLLYYYFSMKEQQTIQLPNVQLAKMPYYSDELLEPGFAKFDEEQPTTIPDIQKKGYSLPEAKNQTQRLTYSYKTDFAIDAVDFISYGKSIGATPAITMALMMSEAIASEKTGDGLVNCNLVTDLRRGVHLENTHRNCVSSLSLAYDPQLGDSPAVMAKSYREKINAYKQPENLKSELRKVVQLSDQLDKLPTFAAKQKALDFFETLLSDTYILSYIGQLNLGIYEQYIEEIHTYSSGSRGLTIEMIATNEKIFLDMMQSFDDERYVKAFCRQLDTHKISYQRKPLKLFSTPKDHLVQRNSKELIV